MRPIYSEFYILEVNFSPVSEKNIYELLTMTVRTLFGENSSNQFYIRLCVQIFNRLFFLLFELLLKYIKIVYRAHWQIFVQNYQWWTFKTVKFHIHGGGPTLKLLQISIFLSEIVPSQRIIYINIHKYGTQLKSISVTVILYISSFCILT